MRLAFLVRIYSSHSQLERDRSEDVETGFSGQSIFLPLAPWKRSIWERGDWLFLSEYIPPTRILKQIYLRTWQTHMFLLVIRGTWQTHIFLLVIPRTCHTVDRIREMRTPSELRVVGFRLALEDVSSLPSSSWEVMIHSRITIVYLWITIDFFHIFIPCLVINKSSDI